MTENTNPPAQQQPPPGHTSVMRPEPADEMAGYAGRGLLEGKVALVTGGDSGIGRAVCVAFAKEGADIALAYLSEDSDAKHTAKLVHSQGRRCLMIGGDLADAQHCADVVRRAIDEFERLDVLVNSGAGGACVLTISTLSILSPRRPPRLRTSRSSSTSSLSTWAATTNSTASDGQLW
ncbi:MAG: SDR family NAD(P)-dependent oxidoreductase, partial [Pseudonocardiaceae bacterium]